MMHFCRLLLCLRVKAADCHLLEPDHIAGIVILQANVSVGWALDRTDRFAPVLAWRQVRCGRVELRNGPVIDLDVDPFTVERDDHRPPVSGWLRWQARGFGERVDGARPMPRVAGIVDLHLETVMDRIPGAE